jgi:hypothetical protein
MDLSGQSAKPATKTSGSEMIVLIMGVAYDDPAFIQLKETLQKTRTVTSIKYGYEHGTAKINLIYPGSSTQLWEELPKATRQYFMVTTMDAGKIVLETKTATVQTSTSASQAKATINNIDEDCNNCYFNLCRYDGIKTFQGVPYKQVDKDDGTYYYNCDNGVLVVKQVIRNGYGVITEITNDTLLLSNAPVGTKWNVHSSSDNFLGQTTTSFNENSIYKKNVTIQVNGVTYHDVIVVYARRYFKNFVTETSSSQYLYYAKGVGLIKTENLGAIRDPSYASDGSNKTEGENAAFEALAKTMKGKVDASITGTWKFHDPTMNWDIFYVFNEDGTYRYYVGSVNPENQMPKGKCYWRLNGGSLQMLADGWGKVYTFELQKKNDAATNKPALVIQFRGSEYRTFISEDDREMWK